MKSWEKQLFKREIKSLAINNTNTFVRFLQLCYYTKLLPACYTQQSQTGDNDSIHKEEEVGRSKDNSGTFQFRWSSTPLLWREKQGRGIYLDMYLDSSTKMGLRSKFLLLHCCKRRQADKSDIDSARRRYPSHEARRRRRWAGSISRHVYSLQRNEHKTRTEVSFAREGFSLNRKSIEPFLSLSSFFSAHPLRTWERRTICFPPRHEDAIPHLYILLQEKCHFLRKVVII